MRRALEGVRVLDFSWIGTGPHCGQLLAFLGAEVIKVESTRRLDSSRNGFYRPSKSIEESYDFNSFNMGKLSLRLNLAAQGARDLVLRLVDVCDIVLENYRPGVFERLGYKYDALRRRRPDIIVLSCSTHGGGGPESSYPGFAPVFAALGGLALQTGHPDRRPSYFYDSMDLRISGTLAFVSLAALAHRRRTGQGQYVDLSGTEVAAFLSGHSLLEYTMNGRVPQRRGNLDEQMCPHNVYPCKPRDLGTERDHDQWVAIAVRTDVEWQALCRATGHPEWASDPRFMDLATRKRHEADLDALLSLWTRQRDKDEVMRLLQTAGVAAMPSWDAQELARNEHLAARDAFAQVQHPHMGAMTDVGPPWRLSGTPAGVERAGPLLGEHNDYVLREALGLSDDEVAELERHKVLS